MARLTRSRRSAFARGLALFMTAVAVFQFGPARGEPGDIFVSPAPVLGSDAPKASDLRDGDASVSTQTGALQYSYPIQVPPGRHGMAPSLALSYSSQAPIYGGVAAGWSLSIPAISEDISQGRLRTHSPEVEAAQGALRGLDDRFVSSLAGGRPLINVAEPSSAGVYMTYRAQNDTSFTRYERMDAGIPYRWRAYATDGKVLYFGDSSLTDKCTTVRDGFAPLTRSVDAFGNEVAYRYGFASGECRIEEITWGQHPPSGLTQPFAKVVFGWQAMPTCAGIPIGSQSSYRTGQRVVTGASRLISISATAFPPGSPGSPEHTRLITLAYSVGSENCTGQHSAVRFLASIQESAWGTDAPRVDLPAVTFEYGDPTINLITPQILNGTPWGGSEPRKHNLAWGYRRDDGRWPTVEAMLLDIDGDGLLDRVSNASNETAPGDGECRARWQKNLGPPVGSSHPTFAGEQPLLTFPRLKWNGTDINGAPPSGATTADPQFPHLEDCALNGQATSFRNSVDAFGVCHNNTSCAAGTSAPGPFCYPGGTECTPGAGGGDGTYQTYLAYRWLDMDADGLVDLVAAVHGDIDIYDIVQGNRLYNGAPRPPEPAIFGAWPTCPNMDRCRQVQASCVDQARICTANGVCTIDGTVLNTCLNQATTVPCFALTNDAPPVELGPKYRAPYSRCEGLYPWFIYKNTGRGTFATSPVIKYQPIPLESDTGDSSIVSSTVSAQNHAVLDFDGDGVLDAVVHPGNTTGSHWFVWLGDGTGGFLPTRYTFPTRPGPNNRISGAGVDSGQWVKSSEGLFDINGDGLAEHWLNPDLFSAFNANLAFHDGTQHRLMSTASGLAGEIDTPQRSTYGVKPGNDAKTIVTSYQGTRILAGTSSSLNRTVDVDDDGRIDVVNYIPGTFTPIVFFNAGGQFQDQGPYYATDYSGFLRTVKAIDDADGLMWELSGDLVDLEGNGIPEAAYFGVEGFVRAEHNPIAPPPRLMRAIHGGTGAHTAVVYASMHDKSAVAQDTVLTWSDGRPKASPNTQWVVKSLTVTDDFAGTTSTTTQFYRNPRHGRDDIGHYGFRGFEEASTTGPSGAKTVKRYAYSPDWSGRLVATLVHPAEAPSEVRSIDRATWTERQLFAGTVKTYHATLSEHLTCANGQTEATCTPTAAPGYTRTTTTQTALGSTTQSGGPVLLWQDTSALLQAGTAAADGDRQTTSTFALHADGSTYRLRQRTSIQHERVAGAMAMFARSEQTWDSTYRVQLTDEVWSDTIDANRAKSATEYDMSTGNVVRRWKPKQYAAGTTSTTLQYDSRKLLAATETNELGHQLDHTYEYGTGATLITSGPNTRTCTSGCPSGAIYPIKQQQKIRVDGLGRTIEAWDTLSDDGNIYTLHQRDAISYVDAPTAGPTSVTRQTRLDTAQSVWTQDKTEMDGHGRPLRQTVFVQGSAPADQVSTFQYGNDGTLRAVHLPDPTANSSATVAYTYGYDSLGRATSIRRPDSATAGSQSGANIAYDGVTQTTTEVVGAAGGQVAVTRTVNDKFGRLIQVLEQTQASPVTWATTTYRYGPDDNVNTVIDPQGITTTLTHDLAGRRTRIIRAGRTWKYTYDRNDNLIAEQVPGSSGPATDLAYTTTIAYDDLDRPLSKVIGQRNLSAADQAAFGAGTESYTWDYGANAKGQLRSWRTFAPGSITAAVALSLAQNAQGQQIHTEHTLNVAGYPALLRAHHQTYYLFGGARATRFYDPVGGGNETQSQIHYDARAMPQQVTLSRTGQPAQTLAVQTRNVAGLVTSRRTNTTGAMTFVESLWTYDKLGRVASQLVQKGPGPVQVARQDLTYFGNDDPKTLTHALGAVARQFQYGYDPRHQLTSATTTTAGYFTGTYAYGAGGRFTRATEAQTIAPLPAGTEVKPRDVNYVYGGTDPEQVTALTNVAGGQTYASYSYDAAGNQVTRAYPGSNQTWDYVYDGQDQLRRATRKVGGVVSGSEEYWYDNAGNRVAIVKRNAAGARTEMVWFIGDTQAHHDSAGAVTHVYSHLSLGTPVARVDRTSNTTANVEYQFHGLGQSTLAAVDQGGTVNASFSYTPFGSVVEATNAGGAGAGTAAHRRRHNDKHVDDLTDLAYYGVRYYDKTLIAWTQADPLFRFAPDAAWTQPRRASLYAFTVNNALRYIDPDGRYPGEEAVAAIERATAAPRAASAAPVAAGGAAAARSVGVRLLVAAGPVAAALALTYVVSELTGGPLDIPKLVEQTKATMGPTTAAQPPPEIDDDWGSGDEDEPLEPVLPDDEVENVPRPGHRPDGRPLWPHRHPEGPLREGEEEMPPVPAGPPGTTGPLTRPLPLPGSAGGVARGVVSGAAAGAKGGPKKHAKWPVFKGGSDGGRQPDGSVLPFACGIECNSSF